MTINQPGQLSVPLQYLANDQDLAVYIVSVGGVEVVPHEGNYETKTMAMHNGRLQQYPYSLDKEGFLLTSQSSAVTDFYDDKQIVDYYEDEVRMLVQQNTGATRVEVFDHTRRAASEALRVTRQVREHATTIHNDYTPYSAPKRLGELFPDEAETLLTRRFAIINVWRSTAGTVLNHPLAMCDASSVAEKDLIAVKRQAKDRIGEIQFAVYSPGHRWVYFPQMKMDEALLFKTYDSATDGRARYTIHTSFDDPTAIADAAVRESIETRCFVFF